MSILFLNIISAQVGLTNEQENFGYTTGTVATTTGDFLSLTDTPSSYAGDGGDCVKVNVGETGLEFVACGGGGDFSFTDFQSSFDLNITDWVSTYTFNYNQTLAGEDLFVNIDGDVMTGNLNLSGNKLTDVGQVLLSGNITPNNNATFSLGDENSWFKEIFVKSVRSNNITSDNLNSTVIQSQTISTTNVTTRKIIQDGTEDIVVTIG